jgi:hypothetical protein
LSAADRFCASSRYSLASNSAISGADYFLGLRRRLEEQRERAGRGAGEANATGAD